MKMKIITTMKILSVCPSYVRICKVNPRKNKEGRSIDMTELELDAKDLKRLGIEKDSKAKLKVTVEVIK